MSASVVIEDHRLVDDIGLAELATLAVDDQVATRERIVNDLGLSRQRVRSVAEATKFYGAPMSDEELKIWLAFLPTSYSKEKGNWDTYTFDHIPDDVLVEIQVADSLRVFQDLKIWTPEVQDRFDPMVVGTVIEGNKTYYFKIIRWGESLASFESIKFVVNARKRAERNWGIGLVAATLLVAGLIAGQIADHIIASSQNVAGGLFLLALFGSMLTMMLICLVFMSLGNWVHRRVFKRYQVDQTYTPQNTPTSQVAAA